MIVGDFNVWMDEQDDNDTKQLLTLMNAYGLTQMIKEATHTAGHTLDHVYINEAQIELKCEVRERLGISTDHFPILIELPSFKNEVSKETVTFHKMKDIDMAALKTELKEAYSEIDCRSGNLA